MAVRRRLDQELVRRKLVATPELARELVQEHRVLVGGVLADNPGRLVTPSESVSVKRAPTRFVSRGGEKLAAALAEFECDVANLRVIDVGSSTGGFTDCVLQNGAREVVAIDVGTNQLDLRLREDPRVTVLEQTNIRHVDPATIEPADLIVADLSFISLTKVFGVFASLLLPHGKCITLVKPQFEVTHEEASAAQGVITDKALWRRTLIEVINSAAQQQLHCTALMAAPITGTTGNVEFLIMLERLEAFSVDSHNGEEPSLHEMIDIAIEGAGVLTNLKPGESTS